MVSPGAAVVRPIKPLQKPHILEKPAVVGPSITFETLHIPDPPRTQENKVPQPPANDLSITIPQQSPEFSQETKEKKKLDDEAQQSADIESKSFENDIDTIETMDVDIITSKIRGECKTLIKQLRLEHLGER
jgi:hypothetical protein